MIGLITWLRWSIAISLHCKDSFPHFVINKQFMNQYSVTQKYFRIQWWFLSYFKCISGDCKTVIPCSPNFLIPLYLLAGILLQKGTLSLLLQLFLSSLWHVAFFVQCIIIDFYHYSFWYSNYLHFLQGCPLMSDSITGIIINNKT